MSGGAGAVPGLCGGHVQADTTVSRGRLSTPGKWSRLGVPCSVLPALYLALPELPSLLRHSIKLNIHSGKKSPCLLLILHFQNYPTWLTHSIKLNILLRKKNVPRALNLTLSKLPSSSPHSIKQNIHGREKERKAKNKK